MTRLETIIMPVGAGQPGPESTPAGPQAANIEAKSSIPGMLPEIHATLIQHYPPEFIEEQRGKYGTHEDFLKAAEEEAKRIDAIKVEEQVRANAVLPEKERLEAAEKLLGITFDETQRKALLKMHEIGKERSESGVFNYTRKEIAEKIKEGKEAFTKEQWKALIRSGLAGRLQPGEVNINPDDYNVNPILKQVATRLQHAADQGLANEDLFNRYAVYLETQLFEGRMTESGAADKAQELLDHLEIWRNEAIELNNLERPSAFTQARLAYDHLMSRPMPTDLAEQRQLLLLQEQSKQRLEQREQEAESHRAQPLRDVRRALLDSYKKIKRTRVHELQGGGRQDMIEHERARGSVQERMWEDFKELAPLKALFGGLPHYIWDGVMAVISREEGQINKENRTIKNPLVERIFTWIKRQRARDRMSTQELRYAQAESYWGGDIVTLFTWPENAREMILTAMDWVKDKLADIGERDPATVNKEMEEIRGRGPMLLKNARIRINSEPVLVAEQGKILETNPEYLRARAFAEGTPDVIANEKIMKKGNKEFGPQAKERFAAKFIQNFEAIYLENRSAAYLMYLLARYKDGTYWTGHDWDVEKPLDDMRDYRAEIQEELLAEAAARDFFTESIFANHQDLDLFSELVKNEEDREDVRLGYTGFFELRDKSKLQYSFDDPLERLLLDPDDEIRKEIRKEIVKTGDAEASKRHDLRVAVFLRTKEMLSERGGLGFADMAQIRQLEKIKRRPLSDEELAWLTEKGKAAVRAQLQLQHPTESQQWIEDQLLKEQETRRQEGTRKRIRQQMEKISKSSSDLAQRSKDDLEAFDKAQKDGNLAECNRLAWSWVKDYNSSRIESHLPKWYPSGWDRVRIKIDRPAKVIDRSLTDEEFEAMYEKAYLPQASEGDTEAKARVQDIIAGRKEDARFGFELARSFGIFQMEDTLLGGMRTRLRAPKGYKLNGKDVSGEYIGRLPDDETSLLLDLIREKKDPQTGQVEYETVDPDRKTLRVWDVVKVRLKAAIAAEEKEIKPFKEAQLQAEIAYYDGGRTADAKKAYEDATTELREKLANSQFVATLALKAIGLVNGELPVWSHNFLDNATIRAFGEAMAQYGVEVARGIPFADYKKEIYEYLERGRRGLVSELDRAAQEFMEGKYPVYEHDIDGNTVYKEDGNGEKVPEPAISLFTASNDWGEPGPMEERYRNVNKGAVAEDTEVTETEFNISTSGGVKFTEYISHARLNFFPLGIWLAAPTILDLNNYIKRRNEVEYHRQKFFDPKDAPQNARAQAAAYLARIALTGGSLGEGKSTPGFLMEPFNGAFTIADWYRRISKEYDLERTIKMKNTAEYVIAMEDMRAGKILLDNEKLERLRQLTYEDFDNLSKYKEVGDDFYNTTYKTFGNFVTWLQAEKAVEQNRIGNAPRNYASENAKRWYAFRREIRKSIQGEKKPDGTWKKKPEQGFISRLGYSPEIASELSIRQLEVGMQDADYLILRDYERERLAQEGALILSKVLTGAEKQKGPSLLDETTWNDPELRKDVKKALENVRRRDLLEFMKEEGFSWYTKIEDGERKGQYKRDEKQYLGEKVPEEVRKKTNGTKVVPFKDINVMKYAA